MLWYLLNYSRPNLVEYWLSKSLTLHELQKRVISIFLKNNLAAGLLFHSWHWSGQLSLQINMLLPPLLLLLHPRGGRNLVSQNTPFIFQLISGKCKYGSYGSDQRLPRDVPMGRWLTSDLWPLQSPDVTAAWWALVMVGQKRRTWQVLEGEKGQSCCLGCDDAWKSPFACPSPPHPSLGSHTIILKAEPQLVIHQHSFLFRF